MSRLAVLVPGGKGQVGSELSAILAARHDGLVHAPGSAELDITDREEVRDAVEAFAEAARDADLSPVVINTAAYTAVDAAETDPNSARQVNVAGPAALAEACRDGDLPLLHVSTDYVFPGDADRPYEPTDDTGPRTVYGRTKLDGEQAVLDSGARAWIVRTAWVYGAHGGNFVKTMARLAAQRDRLTVVDDQIGSPTWAADLAAGLLELAEPVAAGRGPAQRVLHCTNSGSTSWFEFARAIFTELGLDPQRVDPCTTADYPTKTPRPAYSVLSGNAWRDADLTPLRPWHDALREALTSNPEAFRPR
ncbi:dTDP-4-dehydrorhamnose reductase [Saccharopolyspora flava]|uniref:dTDP-4-dehydrorhamnose reductase n=1 Tax=Saccharopolyspora flava TaxID=95161 RepID=A0A1I6PKC5_9PSEU|nr:dTDP-4-dehydrorhamnose reductase [Saccharopolyspora flava]SFS40590.1 dTDP-4-dehydrorhamnose reductase [Saccharopolyspora flava]